MSTPVRTRIWLEEPEAGDAGTRAAYCHGYDVYGDMLGQSRWVEMLYLLLRGEAPKACDADLLEALAVALANAGPRHASVHAAMCAGVGGSTAASALMAALAVGAGQQGGAREVFLAMHDWLHCGTDLQAWRDRFTSTPQAIASIWPGCGHPPGFDPASARTATIVKQALHRMATLSTGPRLCWMAEHLNALQALGGMGVTMEGIAAAALCDLGFTPEQGEMLHLLLRLPGAAAHALEHKALGHKNFPFFQVELEDDPRTKEAAQ